MTLRARLSKLEARTGPASAGHFWEADLAAGLWREVHTGQAGPALSEAEHQRAQDAGGLLLTFPGGKVYAGLRWRDI